MKKIVALLLSIMMLALAAAPALADEPYEVSIQFVGLFEENRNIANVEAALNKITLEKIGCTVDIVPVFIGNLPSTTSLGVAGDEKLDIVVAGLTSPLDTMVKDELLLPLDELLAESDFISVHAPAVDGGAIINADTIAKMKDGVCIINTSRGANLDEDALLAGLESGKVRAAGLDVYASEPAQNKALYSHPMVSCTPHIGASTVEAQKRIGQEIVDIITKQFEL